MEKVLVPISALEHWSYCPRQCGLIHVESVWDENLFTIKGTHMHERADQPISRTERGRRVERALPVWSESLGLTGRGDVVEFGPEGRVVPVEAKSGGRQGLRHASLQLCAQALCLEEMLGVSVAYGCIYLGQTRERVEVRLDEPLRQRTVQAVEDIRAVLESGRLPAPVNDRRCPTCSLVDACMPGAVLRAARGLPDLLKPWNERELP